jgi:hypothetical protein
MRYVNQTKTGVGGNCFAACIASILDLSLDEVPNFCARDGDWFKEFQRWLVARGLFAFEAELADKPTVSRIPPEALCIVSGKSPRDDILHSIVCRGSWEHGFVGVHDLMPGGGWLEGEPKYITIIAAINPSVSRVVASDGERLAEVAAA